MDIYHLRDVIIPKGNLELFNRMLDQCTGDDLWLMKNTDNMEMILGTILFHGQYTHMGQKLIAFHKEHKMKWKCDNDDIKQYIYFAKCRDQRRKSKAACIEHMSYDDYVKSYGSNTLEQYDNVIDDFFSQISQN